MEYLESQKVKFQTFDASLNLQKTKELVRSQHERDKGSTQIKEDNFY